MEIVILNSWADDNHLEDIDITEVVAVDRRLHEDDINSRYWLDMYSTGLVFIGTGESSIDFWEVFTGREGE